MSKKLNQEQSNVSQLMKESEGIKLVRERSTGSNIFDAERQVFSKNPCSSCCFHPGESLLRSLIFSVQRDSCVFPPLLLLPASLFTNAAPQFLLSQLKMQRWALFEDFTRLPLFLEFQMQEVTEIFRDINMSLAWSGRRSWSRPTTAFRRSSHCLVVSDMISFSWPGVEMFGDWWKCRNRL